MTDFSTAINTAEYVINDKIIFNEVKSIENAIIDAANKDEYRTEVYDTEMTDTNVGSSIPAEFTVSMKPNYLTCSSLGKNYKEDDILIIKREGITPSVKNYITNDYILINGGYNYKENDLLTVKSDLFEKLPLIKVLSVSTFGSILDIEVIEKGIISENITNRNFNLVNVESEYGNSAVISLSSEINEYNDTKLKVTKVDENGAIRDFEILEYGDYISISENEFDVDIEGGEPVELEKIHNNLVLEFENHYLYIDKDIVNTLKDKELTKLCNIEYTDEYYYIIDNKELFIGIKNNQSGVYIGNTLYYPIDKEFINDYLIIDFSINNFEGQYEFTEVNEEYTPKYQLNLSGINAKFTVNWGVNKITILNAGKGYNSPVPVFSDGDAEVELEADDEGAIIKAEVTYPGDNYISVPTLSIQNTSLSQLYYQVWRGVVNNPVLENRMNKVIKFFEGLGYTISRVKNPITDSTTFKWIIKWL